MTCILCEKDFIELKSGVLKNLELCMKAGYCSIECAREDDWYFNTPDYIFNKIWPGQFIVEVV